MKFVGYFNTFIDIQKKYMNLSMHLGALTE